jgi:hypothetical protein
LVPQTLPWAQVPQTQPLASLPHCLAPHWLAAQTWQLPPLHLLPGSQSLPQDFVPQMGSTPQVREPQLGTQGVSHWVSELQTSPTAQQTLPHLSWLAGQESEASRPAGWPVSEVLSTGGLPQPARAERVTTTAKRLSSDLISTS